MSLKRPEFVSKELYQQATAVKFFLENTIDNWYEAVAMAEGVSVEEAKKACLLALKNEALERALTEGEQVAKWWYEYTKLDALLGELKDE